MARTKLSQTATKKKMRTVVGKILKSPVMKKVGRKVLTKVKERIAKSPALARLRGKGVKKAVGKLVDSVRQKKADYAMPMKASSVAALAVERKKRKRPTPVDNPDKSSKRLKGDLRTWEVKPEDALKRRPGRLPTVPKVRAKRAGKQVAHIDNVDGATVRRSRAAAHFPVTPDDVRRNRLQHQNNTHNRARASLPSKVLEHGRHAVMDVVNTYMKNFDPAQLTTGVASKVHDVARGRGASALKAAYNQVSPSTRGGGGSSVAKDPLGLQAVHG